MTDELPHPVTRVRSVIVMKFGGTSVEDAAAIDRVAGIVKGRVAERPFVVISAMAKVTDQLLAMAAAAGRGDREQALDICRALRERHYTTAGELLGTGCIPNCTPIWAPSSTRWRSCCAGLPRSASLRRAPPTTLSPSASGCRA